ncbi:sensor histidine kinase [Bacillus sp. SJS]|uniref:sensor histidine kinase n=1 Tax=Bacillus sp. SJS TaxID=1423321 RepID=UPI0004DD0A6D|nr:HAMP domain-containing sensor histidine kinase [Bacillus sp. SJS]KZZ84118.1 hypothetical protein AS29_013060 [Bacillus sp. SJS]
MKNELPLFTSTRKNLALFNSSILIIFLLLFILVISTVLFFTVYNEQKLEVIDLAKQELAELQTKESHSDNQEGQLYNSKGIFLNYYVKNDGEVLVGDEFNRQLRSTILKSVVNWKPDELSVKYINVDTSSDKDIDLLIASQNVYTKGEKTGTIYIGKDVTYLRDMFFRFILILLGISILFFVIAIIAGRVMTEKAIKPISVSYRLQKEFIADASHELRTPLSVLKSGLEVLELEERVKMSPFSQTILTDLKDEVRSTTKLIQDLLVLVRSDTGEQPLNEERFSLSELSEQSIRAFKSLADQKRIQLKLHYTKDVFLYADKEKVKQALYILIDNAIKYTPDYGMVSVSFSDVHSSGHVTIAVSDTGIGIPEEHLDRIFDRFYRIDKSRERQSGSSGLGLAIAKSVVEALGGSIEAFSNKEQGSDFIIILPDMNSER